MQTQLKKDVQTVTPEGKLIAPRIEGVVTRNAVTQVDDRGTICEVFDPAWALHPAPLVYLYQITIRPGKIKGWHVHQLHDDRIFLSQGDIKVVLYDGREDSPTFGMVNEICRSEHQRDLMVIPAHVYHAHQNIGQKDALLISMPTRAYDHANPDVYRLPLENDVIPYRFEKQAGW